MVDLRIFACAATNCFCVRYITALYSLISPFMDEVTKSKVRIIGSDYYSVLLEEIDEDQIPVEYGGKLHTQWAWPFSDASGCSPQQIEQYRHSPVVAAAVDISK